VTVEVEDDVYEVAEELHARLVLTAVRIEPQMNADKHR
jgi:hypothetical protein